MITTFRIINTFPHIVNFLHLMGAPEIHCLSTYPIFNTVLLTIAITPLYQLSKLIFPT